MRKLDVRDHSGQMAVELALLMPVVIVMSLVLYNLLRFVCICGVFDRVAPNAVLSQGVCASRARAGVFAVDEVRRRIEDALDERSSCSVEVEAVRVGHASVGSPLSVGPLPVCYTCTLEYRPWPASFVLAGVAYDAPAGLRHQRTLVVDGC